MKTKNKSFKRLFAFLVALVMVTALVPSVVFAAAFDDVDTTHDFYKEIEYLYEKGVVDGYGTSGEFKPDNPVNRQEAAKMIGEGAGIKKPSAAHISKLIDLSKASDWAQDYILALEEAGVVKGFGATNEFRPLNNITRGHIAKMIVEAFDLEKGNVDVKLTDIANDSEKEYIEILASNGIVKGFGTTNEFRPKSEVTRGQFAKMVYGAMNWDLEVFSVVATTTEVDSSKLASPGVTLGFAINGGASNADLKQLTDAGYDVEFLATDDVFAGTSAASTSATGKLYDDLDGITEFEYKVVIELDGEVVAESKLVEVEVLDYAAVPGKVEAIDLPAYIRADKLDFVVLSDDYLKVTALNGTKRLLYTDSEYVAQFTALTPGIATIDKASGLVTPVTSGTAKFKVEVKEAGATFDASSTIPVRAVAEFELKIVSAAPVVDNITADPTSVKIHNVVDQKVVLTVKDQYGEPMDGLASDITLEPKAGSTVSYAANALDVSAVANKPGQYSFTLEASGSTVVGKDTLTVKIAGTTKTLAIPVEFVKGDVTSYKLEADAGNVPEMYANLAAPDLEVYFNGYTATGAFAGAQDATLEHTAELTGPTGNNATLNESGADEGLFIIEGADKVGAYTLTLKKGSVVKYSIKINVVDAAPSITGVKLLKTGLTTTGPHDIEDLVEVTLSEALGDYFDHGSDKDTLALENGDIVVNFADGSTVAILGTYDVVPHPSDTGASYDKEAGEIVLNVETSGTLYVRVFKGSNTFAPDFVVQVTFNVPAE